MVFLFLKKELILLRQKMANYRKVHLKKEYYDAQISAFSPRATAPHTLKPYQKNIGIVLIAHKTPHFIQILLEHYRDKTQIISQETVKNKTLIFLLSFFR